MFGKLWRLAAASIVTSFSLVPAPVLAQPRELRSVDPPIVDADGGQPIWIHGQSFVPGCQVWFGETPIADREFYRADVLTGRVPTLPPGVHDVRVEWPDGDGRTLLGALQATELRVPPVANLSCVREDAARIRVSWTNPIAYDGLLVEYEEGASLGLPGTRTEVTVPASPDPEWAIRVVGQADGVLSHEVFCRPIELDCPDQLTSVLSMTPGLGRYSLRGEDSDERVVRFTVAEAIPGVRIRVLSERVGPGALRARIRAFATPGTVLADDVPIEPVGLVLGEAWREGEVAVTLDPGVYLVGFWVDGGSSQSVSFELLRQDIPPTIASPNGAIIAQAGVLPIALSPGENPVAAETFAEGDILALVHEAPATSPGRRLGPILTQRPHPSTFLVRYATEELIGRRRSTVVLDANPSPSIQASTLRYEWTFGDGTAASSAGAKILHTFPAEGQYRVRVEAFDAECRSERVEQIVWTRSDLPSLPASGPALVSNVSPGPDDLTLLAVPESIPLDDMPTFDFEVLVTPSRRADGTLHTLGDVEMTLRRADGFVVDSALATRRPTGTPHTYFRATLEPDLRLLDETGQITSDDGLILEIRAEQDSGPATELQVTYPLCGLQRLFRRGDLTRTQIVYDAVRREYRVTGTFPREVLELPADIGFLGDETIRNEVEFGVRLDFRLRDRRWTYDAARAVIGGRLFDQEIPSHEIDLGLGDGLSLAGCLANGIFLEETEFRIPMTITNLFSEGAAVATDGGTLFEGSYAAHGNIQFWGRGRASANALGATTNVDVEIETFLFGGFDAEGYFDILDGLEGEWLLVTGGLQARFPVVLDVDTGDFTYAWNPCVQAKLAMASADCTFWVCSSEPLSTVAEIDLPDGCFAEWLAEDERKGDRAKIAIPDDPPAALSHRSPSVAASPRADLAIIVHQVAPEFGGRDRASRVVFSIGRDGEWSEPAPIHESAAPQRGPRVAFVGPSTAIAVWEEVALTGLELDGLLRAAPRDPAARARLRHANEVWFAMWDDGRGWTAPVRVTNDDLPIGRLDLAAIPGTEDAWVTWVEADDPEYYTPRVGGDRRALGVRAARVGRRVSRPVTLEVSEDSNGRYIDLEPAVGTSPTGGGALFTWIRDRDGDMRTPTDRRLMLRWFRGEWEDPLEYSVDLMGGFLMPSVALSSDDDGIIAVTATPSYDPSDSVDAGAPRLYLVGIRDGNASGPRLLEALPTSEHGRAAARSRWPRVLHVSDDDFVVLFRSIASRTNEYGHRGELGIASAKLTNTDVSTSFLRSLTNDAHRDAEVVGAIDARGRLLTVRNSGAARGGLDGLLPQVVSIEPDVKVEAIHLSDPWAKPGDRVDVIAQLRNCGLVGVPVEPGNGEEAPPNLSAVLVEILEDGSRTELGTYEGRVKAEPDRIVPIRFPTVARARSARLEVTVRATGDRNAANDTLVSDAVFGPLPPASLACALDEEGGVHAAVLSWTNVAIHDAILVERSGVLIATLAGSATSHVDAGLDEGEWTYSIRSVAGGSLSASVDAECELTIRVDPAPEGEFRRADSNADGGVDITDGIFTLGFLFLGSDAPSCEDAADANDDGGIALTDAVYTLNFLFLGGREPPAPSRTCGEDGTRDGLECGRFGPCR